MLVLVLCGDLPRAIGYFDGAIFSVENKSGLGIVIHDSAGLVIASCTQLLPQAYLTFEVEA